MCAERRSERARAEIRNAIAVQEWEMVCRAKRSSAATFTPLVASLLLEEQHLMLVDVRVVLRERLGEHMRAVVATHEIQVRHVRGRSAASRAAFPGAAIGPGGSPEYL